MAFQNPWQQGSNRNTNREPNKEQPSQQNPQGKTSSKVNFDNFLDKIKKMLAQNGNNGHNRNSNGGRNNNINNAKIAVTVVVLLIIIWLGSGFYKVDANEKAVVMRFGAYVRTENPGLNYHLPYPIETVITKMVTRINKIDIGFRNNEDNSRDVEVIEESLMLTGDENIVDINFEVQWKIKNIRDYAFSLRSQTETVKSVAESVMREVIGKSLIDSVLTEGRSSIEENAKSLMQNILDSYNSGIEIVLVQMLKVDPPAQVIESFRDVQTARADRERQINQSEAYRNDIIPRAKGEAQKIIEDAIAYKSETVLSAKGQSERFNKVYNEYLKAKDVTKKRMYIETMEQIFRDIDKIIVDDKVATKGLMPIMPFGQQIMPPPPPTTTNVTNK